MNVLVIADRKPDTPLTSLASQDNIDVIMTLGDLARDDILDLAEITTIPKIGVYGNHDSGNYMPELGIWDMHLKLWDYKGLRFGGFQGCVRYKSNPDAIMYTQEEARQLMAGFPRVDVFLSHCPPFGINDEPEAAHQGFYALREYLDNMQPRVWLHGHTYPRPETLVTQHGSTRIEYIFGCRVVEVP